MIKRSYPDEKSDVVTAGAVGEQLLRKVLNTVDEWKKDIVLRLPEQFIVRLKVSRRGSGSVQVLWVRPNNVVVLNKHDGTVAYGVHAADGKFTVQMVAPSVRSDAVYDAKAKVQALLKNYPAHIARDVVNSTKYIAEKLLVETGNGGYVQASILDNTWYLTGKKTRVKAYYVQTISNELVPTVIDVSIEDVYLRRNTIDPDTGLVKTPVENTMFGVVDGVNKSLAGYYILLDSEYYTDIVLSPPTVSSVADTSEQTGEYNFFPLNPAAPWELTGSSWSNNRSTGPYTVKSPNPYKKLSSKLYDDVTYVSSSSYSIQNITQSGTFSNSYARYIDASYYNESVQVYSRETKTEYYVGVDGSLKTIPANTQVVVDTSTRSVTSYTGIPDTDGVGYVGRTGGTTTTHNTTDIAGETYSLSDKGAEVRVGGFTATLKNGAIDGTPVLDKTGKAVMYEALGVYAHANEAYIEAQGHTLENITGTTVDVAPSIEQYSTRSVGTQVITRLATFAGSASVFDGAATNVTDATTTYTTRYTQKVYIPHMPLRLYPKYNGVSAPLVKPVMLVRPSGSGGEEAIVYLANISTASVALSLPGSGKSASQIAANVRAAVNTLQTNPNSCIDKFPGLVAALLDFEAALNADASSANYTDTVERAYIQAAKACVHTQHASHIPDGVKAYELLMNAANRGGGVLYVVPPAS